MTVVLSVVLPPTAQAHFGPIRHAGFVSKVDNVVNGHGISAIADASGRVTITVPGDHRIVVFGYQHEPFLRFAAGAVYENEQAPTALVNRNEPAGTSDASAAPRWQRLARARAWTWHDHRVHWMGRAPPSVVRHARRNQHVFTWTIPLSVDGRHAAVLGTLDWRPARSASGWWWGVALAACFAVTAYVGYIVLWKDSQPGRR